MLEGYRSIIELWPDSFRFFYPTGEAPRAGDKVEMPALAKTLRELVAVEKRTPGNRAAKLQAVRDAFYKGSIAKRISAFCEQNGGLIRYGDLAGFHADAGYDAIDCVRMPTRSTSLDSGHRDR